MWRFRIRHDVTFASRASWEDMDMSARGCSEFGVALDEADPTSRIRSSRHELNGC